MVFKCLKGEPITIDGVPLCEDIQVTETPESKTTYVSAKVANPDCAGEMVPIRLMVVGSAGLQVNPVALTLTVPLSGKNLDNRVTFSLVVSVNIKGQLRLVGRIGNRHVDMIFASGDQFTLVNNVRTLFQLLTESRPSSDRSVGSKSIIDKDVKITF